MKPRLYPPFIALLYCVSCVPLSDRTWTGRLIEPVSSGTTFESPVIDSNIEAHAVRQNFPSDSVFAGGGFNLYALQARVAVTERLALIATKDGYIDLDPDALPDESGTADIAGGIKYAAYIDDEQGIIITPGLIIETKSGDTDVFQGNGDGLIRPFVSAGWDLGPTKVLGEFAYNQPLDDDAEATSIDYHLHVSHEVHKDLFPMVEINGITYTSNGTAFPANFEGGDLINLGATNVAGNTVITGALGAAYRIGDRWQAGIVYEWPLTSREDLLDDRIWASLLWRF